MQETDSCTSHASGETLILNSPGMGGTVGKTLPANAGDLGDMGSIPGLGRSPGEGHGNPLQYSCLENPVH